MWVENSPAYDVHDIDLFQLIQNDINRYECAGSVLMCGDWHARVGNGSRPDYIDCDTNIDMIDHDDYTPDVHLSRVSKDTRCNSHGLKLQDLCKASGFRLANGRLLRIL